MRSFLPCSSCCCPFGVLSSFVFRVSCGRGQVSCPFVCSLASPRLHLLSPGERYRTRRVSACLAISLGTSGGGTPKTRLSQHFPTPAPALRCAARLQPWRRSVLGGWSTPTLNRNTRRARTLAFETALAHRIGRRWNSMLRSRLAVGIVGLAVAASSVAAQRASPAENQPGGAG